MIGQNTKIVALLVFFIFVSLLAQGAGCDDCGGPVPGKECSFYGCDKDRCIAQIIDDCCGNNKCELGESFGSCSNDCEPQTIDFELLNPDRTEGFFKGEPVLFKIKLSSENSNVVGAEAVLSGVFGKIVLYDDGEHEDEIASDGIYANRFFIDPEVKGSRPALSLKATLGEVTEVKYYSFQIDPTLGVELDVNTNHRLGNVIPIKGIVKKKEHRFALPLKIKIMRGQTQLFETDTESALDGSFQTEFRTTLLDPNGTWTIGVYGADANSNSISHEQEIKLLKPDEAAFLKVEIEGIEQSYKRGSEIVINATVKDDSGKAIENASMRLFSPLHEEIEKMLPDGVGRYTGSYTIPYDLSLGSQEISVSASKSGEGGTMAGSAAVRFKVEKAVINIEVFSPDKRHYQIGENIAPEVFLSYSETEWVLKADVKAVIQHVETGAEDIDLELQPVAGGLFSTNYSLSDNDEGLIKLVITVVDDAGNEGYSESVLLVSGTSLGFVAGENIIPIAVGLIVLVGAGLFARNLLLKKGTREELLKRRKQLNSLAEELQKKYFDENAIPTEKYQELIKTYETELGEVEKKMGELDKSAKTSK